VIPLDPGADHDTGQPASGHSPTRVANHPAQPADRTCQPISPTAWRRPPAAGIAPPQSYIIEDGFLETGASATRATPPNAASDAQSGDLPSNLRRRCRADLRLTADRRLPHARAMTETLQPRTRSFQVSVTDNAPSIPTLAERAPSMILHAVRLRRPLPSGMFARYCAQSATAARMTR